MITRPLREEVMVNSVPRRIEQDPGQETREKLRVAESSLASGRRSVMSVDLHPRKRPSEASEIIEGSQISRRRSGEGAGVRSGKTSRIMSPRRERMDTAYSGWEEPNFTHRPARKSSPVPQEGMSLADYVDLPRRSGEGTDVRSGRTLRITPPRKERIDTAYSGWEEPNFTRQPARRPSPVPQEEMSLTDYVDLPRRSGEGTDVRSGRTSRIVPPRKERIDTAYSGCEETNFTRQPARKPSPVPQEEMSLTDYADLPPITQHERRSDRENPFARIRMRPEPPLFPLRENETFRKNRPSQYSMETPCIHVDPPRVVRSYHDSRQTIEFEAPSRVPAPNSYRDENSPRHPSTQVQNT